MAAASPTGPAPAISTSISLPLSFTACPLPSCSTMPARSRGGLCGCFLSNGIDQQADALDLDFADIAGLHEERRLARAADTGRRAGDDDIARFQGDRLADDRDQARDIEH